MNKLISLNTLRQSQKLKMHFDSVTFESFVKIYFDIFQFNFVGKLLGPKGNSMKRLQEDTMTKMAVLGRGSMRNKQQVSPNKNIHLLFTNQT